MPRARLREAVSVSEVMALRTMEMKQKSMATSETHIPSLHSSWDAMVRRHRWS